MTLDVARLLVRDTLLQKVLPEIVGTLQSVITLIHRLKLALEDETEVGRPEETHL